MRTKSAAEVVHGIEAALAAYLLQRKRCFGEKPVRDLKPVLNKSVNRGAAHIRPEAPASLASADIRRSSDILESYRLGVMLIDIRQHLLYTDSCDKLHPCGLRPRQGIELRWSRAA